MGLWMYVYFFVMFNKTKCFIYSGIMAELKTGQALFGKEFFIDYSIVLFLCNIFKAGENDIDQLYRIQRCLGPLPTKYVSMLNSNPKFQGLKVFFRVLLVKALIKFIYRI